MNINQQKQERIKRQLDFMNESISDRFKLLPLISTILGAILSAFLFSQRADMVIINYLISIFSLLIPILLFYYNNELKNKHREAKKIIKEILESMGDRTTSDKVEEYYGLSFEGLLPEISIIALFIATLFISLFLLGNALSLFLILVGFLFVWLILKKLLIFLDRYIKAKNEK